ncbi:MAG: 50S ribosomal protein L13 [Chitinophagales bacterium]|nr:50S ribosomal protein L13 [Chitinophagales bacterium]HAE13424.1 50S ribosomal protein L13 [Bacteroidota bacterium]MCB9020111.1 50S ribosomal protein L13 [Chitinophagales bacterium]MCB9021520.1 50S ribosomal protein L13 [Chitinophagales bacterium]MCB9032043.1 50S ribosomal protein L13 [Chitinophagales bacterium]
MDTLSFKTVSANNATVTRKWLIVDAEGQTLGRLSTRVAAILRGKNKPYFTPHVDCGDYVIIINAEKVKLTGSKMLDKVIQHYTGHPGGRKVTNPRTLLRNNPEKLLERSIKGMLPKNKLGSAMYKKLFVYAGSEHPHVAQKPETLTF